MRVQNINSFNFESKKFRIPVKMIKENVDPIVAGRQYQPSDFFVKGNFVKEYSNPKAEEYFYKALETSNLDEKMRYLEKMGKYKIVDISLEKQKDSFIDAVDNMP